MNEQFTIGKLAKLTGYSPGMIRYLEKCRVISPSARTPSGYRLFGPQHVDELRFVREMQDLGFYAPQIRSLREIKSSSLPAQEIRQAIERVFDEHARYVVEKAAYFATLQGRLQAAAPCFVERVMHGDC